MHNFNPRSPHGERQTILSLFVLAIRFQSTLPAWGATKNGEKKNVNAFISIPAPRMGSDIPYIS
ncbi:MAG: hypothetical protein UDM29_04105, partial [Dialister sp.]|nr:hypothetical protein [Dialister sp.]